MSLTLARLGIVAGSFPIAAGGDFESIATVTVGSGGASSIEFTSIGTDWQHLQIRGVFRESRALTSTAAMQIRVNGDTGSNYTYHWLYGTGSSAAAGAGASQSIGAVTDIPRNSETSSAFAAAVIDILDYDNTSKNKTIRIFGGYEGNNSNGIVMVNSSLWMSTSAITSILLRPSGGSGDFVQHTTAALFGIKAP